jgi:chromosome segregation protein
LAECERSLKAAETAAMSAREARIRADAAHDHARQASLNLAERIGERLSLAPAQLPAPDVDANAEALEQRLSRLQREREGLGTVNLLADEEITELEQRLATLIAERDDLTTAIAKLRRGIGDLNRNAREKLLAAFESVNHHFGRLFTRLFGGGEAQLQLVGHDDPLEAGLEVFACPPGKKPQALTALSGGERALTAVALLFAAFLTNPAPICVLDEVDAPLDDANVDRLCRLIEEIADEAGTRFLCITHHRLTMARMDRLYGVTMEERGVSRLVSVDLRQADSFRDAKAPMRAAE